MSTTTIRYKGVQENWPEVAVTGKQSRWLRGQTEARPDAEAAALLATGLFELAGLRAAQFMDAPGGRFDLLTPDGGVVALSEAVEHGTSLTATGTGYDGAGYFAGLNVTAYDGGPQTITVRDGVDDSGPIIRVYVVDGAGVYPFGAGMRLKIQTGVHLTISGGTSRTVLALVEPGPVVTGG